MNMEIFTDPFPIKRVVLSFSGWPDAGKIIEHTLAELTRLMPSQEAARLDMDGFWHTESSRPQITIQHGQVRQLNWPAYRFQVLELPTSEKILLGSGPEPGCRWRAFTGKLFRFIKRWSSEEIILLGSLYDRILHDEVLISSVVQNSRDLNLAREIGCQLIEYEGPAAVHSAIMEAARDFNIESLSIWAHLPFYLDGPNELIIANCLKVLGKLLGMEINVEGLMDRWVGREQEIQNLLQTDLELRRMLESVVEEQKRSRAGRRFASKQKVVRLEEFQRKRNSPD
jgi:hypothetical protein